MVVVKNKTIRNLLIGAGILLGVTSVIGGIKKYRKYRLKQNKNMKLKQEENNLLEEPRKYITLK